MLLDNYGFMSRKLCFAIQSPWPQEWQNNTSLQSYPVTAAHYKVSRQTNIFYQWLN